MEPPGRFMKKCTDTGLWVVLSQREAADKTAQAMAYVVRTSRNATKKHISIPLVLTTSQPNPRPIPPSYANTGLEDSASSPTAHPHVPGLRASDLVRRCDTAAERPHELFPTRDSSHQQQLLLLQQFNPTNFPTIISASAAPVHRIAEMEIIARAQAQAQQERLRQLSPQYLMNRQSSIGLQPRLPPPSFPRSISDAPSSFSSAQGVLLPPSTSDFLHQEYSLQGNYGYGIGDQLFQGYMQPNLYDRHGMMGSSYDQSMFGTYASPQEMIQQVDQMERRCSWMLQLQNQQISSLTDARTLPSRRQSLDMVFIRTLQLQQISPNLNFAARLEPSTIATATATAPSSSSSQQRRMMEKTPSLS